MAGKDDPARADALEQYKNKLLELREMEAKLKALRLDIKGLQKDFDTTEDNIKALQSVGQIIGEVLKQLDEERCKHASTQVCTRHWLIDDCSHCQSFIRAKICCRLSVQSRQGEAQAGHTSGSRYDHPHNHAHAAKRS